MADKPQCNCPKIGEQFSPVKHAGACPVHDAPRQYQHTPDTCPICVGKPLLPLRIGRHTCNICGNTSPAYE